MPPRVCVDASVLLKLVLPEPLAEEAAGLLEIWDSIGVELVAPALMPYEVTSSVYKNMRQGMLSEQTALASLQLFSRFELQYFLSEDLSGTAWEVAQRCKQTVLYDSYYLALAELLDCDYWTADERFYRAAHGQYERVRLLGRDHFAA